MFRGTLMIATFQSASAAVVGDRGHITIGTGLQTALPNGHPLQHGDWLVLEISDSGCGMDARGTILVIDDDGAVRHTIRRMVETLGFTVLEATSGLEGLRRLTAQEQAIDGVLVDVTMPGLNGYEILALIRTYLPGMPVILMTGGDASHRHEDGQGGGVPCAPEAADDAHAVGYFRGVAASPVRNPRITASATPPRSRVTPGRRGAG